MRAYQYRCNDYSLLTPPFKKWIISPLIRFVPWVVPANIITLISNLFVYLGLYISMNPSALGVYTPVSITVCLLTYLIGDHLDGMQAKRTGTGSALGEFCDHYLDAFNNGIIVYTMLVFFDITHPILVASAIILSYLAHMAVFYEQFKTGWLRFEPVGSLEGVLMSAVLIGLCSFEPFFEFLTTPLRGVEVSELIILASAFGALITFIQTCNRTPEIKYRYWIFALSLITVGIVSVSALNSFQLFIVLTLFASHYVGKIMYSHLIDGIETGSDWIVPVLMLLFAVPGFLDTEYVFWLTTSYLSARILTLIIKTFSTLRVYWVWQNPRI